MRTVGPLFAVEGNKSFSIFATARHVVCTFIPMSKCIYVEAELAVYWPAGLCNEEKRARNKWKTSTSNIASTCQWMTAVFCTVNIVVMQQALFLFTFCAIFQTATLSCGLLSVKFTLSGCNFIYGMNGRCSKWKQFCWRDFERITLEMQLCMP